MEMCRDLGTMCYVDIRDRLDLHRRAVVFVAESLELANNDEAAANLHMVTFAMKETEELLYLLIQKGIEEQTRLANSQ